MTDLVATFGADWIAAVVSRQLAVEGRGENSSCEVRGPLFERSNSKVFLVRHPGLPGPAAVKLCLRPYTSIPDGSFAREQFDTLHRTRAAMAGNADFSVPDPYFLDEEHGVLGMEWIAGTEMTAAIFAIRGTVSAAEQLLCRAGQWLRHFHTAGRVSQRCLDTGHRLGQLQFDAGTSALAGDPVYARAVRQARKMASDVGSVLLDSSWIHGDFKTDNLLVSGGRTVGLDINARFENTLFHDIAPFLNHLDIKLLRPAAWRFVGRRNQLVEAFLAGYGLDRGDAIMRALCWARMVSMLTVWESVAERQRSRLPAMATQWLFRRATSRLIDDLERC